MSNITRSITIILIASLCTPIWAVNSLLGFRYPLGVPTPPASGMGYSMGGAMTGVPADNNLMLGNPANLGNLSKTVFSLFTTLDFNTISRSNSTNTSTGMDFSPSHVSIGLPIGSIGSIGVSYQRRSDMTAHFNALYQTGINQVLDSATIHYVRNGGQVAWSGAWGYSIGKWVQLGIMYERQFTKVQTQNRLMTFEDNRSDITNDSSGTNLSVDGIGGGLMLPLVNMFPGINATIGLSGEYFFSATAHHHEQLMAQNVTLKQNTTLRQSTTEATVKLPPSLRQGISWQSTPELLAALDIKETFWGRYNGGGIFLPTDRATAMGLGAGVQFIPSPNLLLPRYWEIIRYRAGVRYDQLPAKTASEWGVTLGLGLPLPEGNGILDILVEYAQRRDSNWSTVSEDLIKIGIGLNGGRKWVKADQGNY